MSAGINSFHMFKQCVAEQYVFKCLEVPQREIFDFECKRLSGLILYGSWSFDTATFLQVDLN